MSDEQTQTREQELAEEFQTGRDDGDVAQLQAQLETVTAERDALQLALDAKEADWEAQRESLLKDTADALAARDKAEAATKRAKAKVTQGDSPAKPRKLAAMKEGSELSGDDLREAIADADKVEIVLSDGTREIAGIPPIVVEGDTWKEHTLGYMLRDPVEISGPSVGDAGFQIDGYALLIDGKQVAYTKRSDPVNVAGGTKVSLADDIYFA